MDIYDEILKLFDEQELKSEINLISILIILIRISRYNFKIISKGNYLNYLILILNLLMVNIPDYCHSKGKAIKMLNLPEYKIFMEELRREFLH